MSHLPSTKSQQATRNGVSSSADTVSATRKAWAQIIFVSSMKQYVIIMFLTLLAATSCSRQTRASWQLYSEDDVRKFVLPGTPVTAIIQSFGQPVYDEKHPKFEGAFTNVDEIVYFNLPDAPPGTKEIFVFSGFQVRVKDGKAIDWFSSHRTTH